MLVPSGKKGCRVKKKIIDKDGMQLPRWFVNQVPGRHIKGLELGNHSNNMACMAYSPQKHARGSRPSSQTSQTSQTSKKNE